MKRPLYSNRLDHVYKSISNSGEMDLIKFKNTINSVDGEYLLLKPKSIKNFSLHSSDSKSKKEIINNVIERNRREKNKINFESVKLKISRKSNFNNEKSTKLKTLNLTQESEIDSEKDKITTNYKDLFKSSIFRKKSNSIIKSQKTMNEITDIKKFRSDKQFEKEKSIPSFFTLKKKIDFSQNDFKKTRNSSNNQKYFNFINSNSEKLEDNQLISNFASISSEIGANKNRSTRYTFTTFTGSQIIDTACESQKSNFVTPSFIRSKTKLTKSSISQLKEERKIQKLKTLTEENLRKNLIKDEDEQQNKRNEKFRKLMTRSIMKASKSLIDYVDNPKKSKSSNKNKLTKTKIQLFKTSVALNRFLINDFLIGEKIDYVAASKKKIKMTSKFYEQLEKKKTEKVDKIKKNFDIKFGNNELTRKEIFLNNLIQDNHTILESPTEQPDYIPFDLYLSEKKKELKEKIKDESHKIVELIQNVSGVYEEQDSDDFIHSHFNQNNLDRIVKIRNIVKKRGHNVEKDNLGIDEIQMLKNERAMADRNFLSILQSVGPPSFIKTKFRLQTMEKYKNVSGRYFGC